MKNDSFLTVADAAAGEFGWVWIDNTWVMARINDEDLATYPDSHTTQYYDLNDETLGFPWYFLSEPPCDGSEPQPYHVIVRDRGSSVTISGTFPTDETGDKFLQHVVDATRAYLEK